MAAIDIIAPHSPRTRPAISPRSPRDLPGLAMATMDIIAAYGGQPANFLDVGGSAKVPAIAPPSPHDLDRSSHPRPAISPPSRR